MDVKKILETKDINEIELFGSFDNLLKSVETQLSLDLNARNVSSLLEELERIKLCVQEKKKEIDEISKGSSFKDSKSRLSTLLKVDINAKNGRELEATKANLIDVFYSITTDPSVRFEEIKMRNFKNSSQLEGIELSTPEESTSLEKVLEKYKGKDYG